MSKSAADCSSLGIEVSLEFGVWDLELVSSSSSSAAAGFEEMLKALGEAVAGVESQRFHAGATQGAINLGQAVAVGLRKLFTDSASG